MPEPHRDPMHEWEAVISFCDRRYKKRSMSLRVDSTSLSKCPVTAELERDIDPDDRTLLRQTEPNPGASVIVDIQSCSQLVTGTDT